MCAKRGRESKKAKQVRMVDKITVSKELGRGTPETKWLVFLNENWMGLIYMRLTIQ
jgi:hypothetical protein